MGDKTGIEWTSATWNPVTGCAKVSQGCKHCYAKYQAWPRLSSNPASVYHGRKFEEVMCHPERLDQPIRWSKPRRIFVNSMSDLFHEAVPFEFIAAVFAVMASTPKHTYQVLTKRPARMREFFEWLSQKTEGANQRYLESERIQKSVAARQKLRDEGKASLDEPPAPTEELRGLYDVAAPIINAQMDAESRYHHLRAIGEKHWRNWPLSNVWLGVSVEDQETADERIPLLLETPAAVRWISAEPLLGPVDLERVQWPGKHKVDVLRRGAWDLPGWHAGFTNHSDMNGLDWVVVGGESGTDARPMEPDWARSLRDQCTEAGVAFLFKQWGEWAPSQRMDGFMDRIGKKAAGRKLDGRTWDGYPSEPALEG